MLIACQPDLDYFRYVLYFVYTTDGLDGSGPVLVELSKPAGVSLGLTLSGKWDILSDKTWGLEFS